MTSVPELPPSDEELVTLTLRERHHYGLLVERYETKLTRYIRRLGVRTHEDQQDVLQDIFIKAYRNLNGFDTNLSFSSWIYRIAHNEAISWYRKISVRPEGHLIAESEDVLTLVTSKEPDAEVTFDQGINAEMLNKALHAIDEKYRTVLVLRYFEHKEYEEISDILQIPVGSVGTLLHRGKKQLAAELDATHVRIN
jgi:RNA polymerase sigma-70 factor (ECF subfamily)